ncbi:MAG TPA: phospholipase D-like domain-containing protein [Thermoanaerobaculia bacterium]|nr:phospholipase D-like domain-containing protein [Thermoanaerobaculia bacterium]
MFRRPGHKRRWWLPVLHPREGRRLPAELQPENVTRLASALPEGLRDPGLAALLARIDEGHFLGGNRIEIYTRGEEAFGAMCAAIDQARSEVLVESYILKDDATGHGFADRLAAAAARGATVRVLADFFGSFATHARFWAGMRRRGIEVRLFNPLFPHLFLQPFRDHRKILVADRRVAFTGGMNIADEYGSARRARRRGPWRDTQARVEGPTAWEMAVVFSEAWRRSGGSIELEPLEKSGQAGVPILTLDSRPGRGHGETAAVLAAIIAAARRRVWVTNAYFAPRHRAVRLFREAVARGVDVRLLLPGRTDVPFVRHAGHGYYRELLEGGVRIWEYGGATLHAKTLVADDVISIVGSTNLDFRSFHFNAECNLVLLGESAGSAFTAAFEEDLSRSTEVTRTGWRRRRPLHALGDSAARLMAPLL